MTAEREVAVTLTMDLLRHLRSESIRLEVPLEWLVASIVADTIEDVGASSKQKPVAA